MGLCPSILPSPPVEKWEHATKEACDPGKWDTLGWGTCCWWYVAECRLSSLGYHHPSSTAVGGVLFSGTVASTPRPAQARSELQLCGLNPGPQASRAPGFKMCTYLRHTQHHFLTLGDCWWNRYTLMPFIAPPFCLPWPDTHWTGEL